MPLQWNTSKVSSSFIKWFALIEFYRTEELAYTHDFLKGKQSLVIEFLENISTMALNDREKEYEEGFLQESLDENQLKLQDPLCMITEHLILHKVQLLAHIEANDPSSNCFFLFFSKLTYWLILDYCDSPLFLFFNSLPSPLVNPTTSPSATSSPLASLSHFHSIPNSPGDIPIPTGTSPPFGILEALGVEIEFMLIVFQIVAKMFEQTQAFIKEGQIQKDYHKSMCFERDSPSLMIPQKLKNEDHLTYHQSMILFHSHDFLLLQRSLSLQTGLLFGDCLSRKRYMNAMFCISITHSFTWLGI